MKSTVERTSEEDVLRILSEQAPVGVCIMQDGKFCYVNSYFPVAIGYTADGLVGKDSLEIVVPEDKEIVMENTIKMVKGELLSPYQFRVTCKDGSIIWVMATVKSIQYHGRRATLGNYMEITGRKQIEDALKESEERYKELANSITDVFFAMDEHLRYTYWNKASEVLTGIRAEDAIGKSIREIFPNTPWRRKAEKVYRSALRTQQPQTFVNDYDNDGRRYIFRISAYPSRSGISVFVGDITECIQVKETLMQSEERYRTILEEMKDGYFETDLAGNLTFVNDALISLLGYSREETIGMNYRAFTPEEKVKSLFEAYNRMYKIGEPLRDFSREVIRKDGTHGFAQSSAFPIRNDKGEIIGFRGVRHDITERKKAEEALRRSEERYRTILEEMGDGYFEADLAGNFTFVNDAQARLLGYSKEEVIGKNYRAFTPEEKVEPVFQAYNRMYSTGKPIRGFTDEVIRKDGSQGFAETLAFPMRNDKGEIVGFRGIRRDITERKRAEEALRNSEEKLRLISENSRDIICLHDPDHRYVYISLACKEILGYEPDELVGTNPWELVHPEDIEALQKEGQEKALQGMPALLSYRIRKKSGEYVWFESASQLLKDGAGNVLGFVTSSRDITGRKQAEEALELQKAYFQQLFDNSPDAILMMDTNDRAIQANRGFEVLFGYSNEEAKGRSLIELIVPEVDAQEASDSPQRILGGEVVRKESVRRRKDGSLVDVSVLAYPIRSNDKLIGTYGVYSDITERKQAEEALRQSEENYRVLFDSTVIGTIVLDAETMKIAMVNQAAAKMFGFSSAEEARGADSFDFVRPEDKERISKIAAENLFGQDSRQTYELGVVTRDGREIWINATGASIMHEGKLAGLISFTDITEQKRQRERLMVTDRLASLGELAAGTAHELNNPLTSIIGFSQLLMEKESPDDIREDLKLINNEAQRAVKVTRDLLTFARKHAPVKQHNQINNIIEDVLELRAYLQKTNGIEVERQLDPDLPEIMVDYFQIQQVLLNIIINAEYFMTQAHNKGTLTITTKKQNSSVVISIADDGPGILPENLGRIFDPFFTTKEAGSGTGLGLSICHGIVTEHGGQMYVKSQLGKGATIFVELPINRRARIKNML